MNTTDYNRCVELYADRLYRFILKSVKNAFVAEDVVQNVFETLWTKREEVELETVKALLFKMAYNSMIDELRKTKRVVKMDAVKEDSLLDDGGHYTGRMETLEQGLNALPEDQRTVVLLRDYEGYSYKEIGEIAELSESQVKVYIFRARKFLKDFIQKMERVPCK